MVENCKMKEYGEIQKLVRSNKTRMSHLVHADKYLTVCLKFLALFLVSSDEFLSSQSWQLFVAILGCAAELGGKCCPWCKNGVNYESCS